MSFIFQTSLKLNEDAVSALEKRFANIETRVQAIKKHLIRQTLGSSNLTTQQLLIVDLIKEEYLINVPI